MKNNMLSASNKGLTPLIDEKWAVALFQKISEGMINCCEAAEPSDGWHLKIQENEGSHKPCKPAAF